MRTLSLLFFTFRLLLRSALVYNLSRLLPAEYRLRVRQKSTLLGAQEIADFFLDRGGIFLKVAQYLSTVSNLFDLEFSEIFSGIPDRTAPRPYNEIRSRFYKSLRLNQKSCC